MDYEGPERRNLVSRAATTVRLTSMLSSPSLLLTVDETKRLLGLKEEACERILNRLESNGVLEEVQRGVYTPGPVISGVPRK